MTFSEYISEYAWKEYLKYCSQKGIKPIADTQLKQKKICALCKPNEPKTSQTRTKTAKTYE